MKLRIKKINADDPVTRNKNHIYIIKYNDVYDLVIGETKLKMLEDGLISTIYDTTTVYGDDITDETLDITYNQYKRLKYYNQSTSPNFPWLMFRDYATNFKFLPKYKVTKITSLSNFFAYANDLIYADISNWDTSNVTDMSSLFYNLPKLLIVNMNGIDTSKVTDMHNMFQDCVSLKKLYISNLDVSEVTDMSHMFQGVCLEGLLDIKLWDTSTVTNMTSMFLGAEISNIDISGLDTSHVTSMNTMFYNCKANTINLNNINTSSLTSISYFITNCPNITEIDLSSMNTLNVTTYESFVQNCANIKKITFGSGFKINSSVTSLYRIFAFNYKLEEFIFHELDLLHITSAPLLFLNCYMLSKINGTFKNITCDPGFGTCPLTRDSALIVINGLVNLTGQSSRTIQFDSTTKNALSDADKAIITSKNWTLA